MAGDCLEILLKLVEAYDPTAIELGLTISGELTSGQTAPGASVVLQLMQRSKLLKQVSPDQLLEARLFGDQTTQFQGASLSST